MTNVTSVPAGRIELLGYARVVMELRPLGATERGRPSRTRSQTAARWRGECLKKLCRTAEMSLFSSATSFSAKIAHQVQGRAKCNDILV